MVPRLFRSATATLVAVAALSAPARLHAQDGTEAPPYRQFGAWLDDASAPTQGEGQSAVAIGHWRMAGMSQTNVPMLSAGLGVSDHLQLSASLPFYRANFGGVTAGGMDNVYFGAKYNVIDPMLSLSEIGFSVGSIVEVLSAGMAGDRIHFVVPVSVEVRRAPFRWYASGGYFSRGALFTGGAVEWAAPHRVTVTGSLTQSYSTQTNALLDAQSVGRQRVDISASASHPLGNQAATFVNVGRSLSSAAEGGTRLALSGGISFWFRAASLIR